MQKVVESLEVSILEKLVASWESRCLKSWNEQAYDVGGMLENETEVLDLTVTSPSTTWRLQISKKPLYSIWNRFGNTVRSCHDDLVALIS